MPSTPKGKAMPRQPQTVRANLERFPWENPQMRAGLCRIIEMALTKHPDEDRQVTPQEQVAQDSN
jgi:hypothetical protein